MPGRFRLLRYFTLATLGVFIAVGLALYLLQRKEERFFEEVQREQRAFFAKAQAALAEQNEAAARASLLAVHEAAHVNLTRVVANLLWQSDFGPFVAQTQLLPVEHCRALPAGDAGAQSRRECLADHGRQITALPGYQALDAKAYAAMQSTRVFKIKVWDLRGITVYSSERRQIGEDGAANKGWRTAAGGHPASELTHRDRFSAFEGIVENRDLISTYVPVRESGSDRIVGVFELYSDVTPFLEQIRAASRKFADISAANEDRVARTARDNEAAVHGSSNRFLVIVGGLLALLYVAALLIVRIGQRIIDRQTLAQEEAARREQRWHREKMAALAAMAANVSHEVGNPLAVIAGLAQQLTEARPAGDATGESPTRQILQQTQRIAQMMRRISDFAGAHSGSPEAVDVNAMLRSVCEFHAFDRRFRGIAIEFRPGGDLPACELVPDHLNEVMMGLLQACAEVPAGLAPPGRIAVETAARDTEVVVRIGCERAAEAAILHPDDTRLDAVRRRVAEMRGRLAVVDGWTELALPAASS